MLDLDSDQNLQNRPGSGSGSTRQTWIRIRIHKIDPVTDQGPQDVNPFIFVYKLKDLDTKILIYVLNSEVKKGRWFRIKISVPSSCVIPGSAPSTAILPSTQPSSKTSN